MSGMNSDVVGQTADRHAGSVIHLKTLYFKERYQSPILSLYKSDVHVSFC